VRKEREKEIKRQKKRERKKKIMRAMAIKEEEGGQQAKERET